MNTGPVVVVDYDAGNLRSVARALTHVGADPVVSADPDDILNAGAVVLPGVGAAADTMFKLGERRLDVFEQALGCPRHGYSEAMAASGTYRQGGNKVAA